jgi:crotonobetaine/carnitine-CoA ligase
MRKRDETILADLIAVRAEQKPDLDVLTFERGEAPPDVRTYVDLLQNANRIAAALVARGLERGARFGLMMRNHPEFVETMIAASLSGCVYVPIDPRTRGRSSPMLQLRLRRHRVRRLLRAGARGGPGTAAQSSLDWCGTTLRDVLSKNRDAARVGIPTRAADHLARQAPPGSKASSARTADSAPGMLGMFGSAPRSSIQASLTHGNAQSVTLAPALVMSLRSLQPAFHESRFGYLPQARLPFRWSAAWPPSTAAPRRDADNPVLGRGSAATRDLAAVRAAFRRRILGSTVPRTVATTSQ